MSAAALALAFWGVRPDRFVAVLRQADYRAVLPVAALLVVGLLTRARSWHVLLGAEVPYARAFHALNEGYLLNTVLPFRLGEVGRAYLVSRETAISAGRALATVLVERVLDVAITLGGLWLALPYAVGAPWARDVAWGIGGGLLVAMILVAGLSATRGGLENLLARLPGPLGRRLARLFGEFSGGLDLFRSPQRLLLAGFWSLAAWATNWAQLWLLLRAFGQEAPFPLLLFVSGITAFGAAVPSSPGAVGVYELSTVAGLLVFGVPREVALSVAILAHGVQLAGTGLLGAYALARDGETLLGLAARAQSLVAARQEPRVVP